MGLLKRKLCGRQKYKSCASVGMLFQRLLTLKLRENDWVNQEKTAFGVFLAPFINCFCGNVRIVITKNSAKFREQLS